MYFINYNLTEKSPRVLCSGRPYNSPICIILKECKILLLMSLLKQKIFLFNNRLQIVLFEYICIS